MIVFEKEKGSLLSLFSDIKETTLFYNNMHVKMENYNLNNITVRTSFDSNPKTGMDSGLTSPNNKFVENGRKS